MSIQKVILIYTTPPYKYCIGCMKALQPFSRLNIFRIEEGAHVLKYKLFEAITTVLFYTPFSRERNNIFV